jgi:hypothetical protein
LLFGCDLLNVDPLMAVRLFYFFLDKKVTKNQVSKKASFRTWPLPCKITQNHGLQSFALLRSLYCLRFCKICYALPVTHGPHCFG